MTARRRPAGLAVACALSATILAGCGTSSGAGGAASGAAVTGPAASAGAGPATTGQPSMTSEAASVPQAATGSSPASPTPPLAATVIASTPAAPGAGSAVLMLQPDGLGALVSASSIRQLPFGTDLAVVRRTLGATLGPVRTTTSPECGQGPRTTLDVAGFAALFDGSKFVGWTDTGRAGRTLSTANGIQVGSTLGALRSAFGPVTVTADTLGPEFTLASGFGGLLDGTGALARITTLYAGETCFFR